MMIFLFLVVVLVDNDVLLLMVAVVIRDRIGCCFRWWWLLGLVSDSDSGGNVSGDGSISGTLDVGVLDCRWCCRCPLSHSLPFLPPFSCIVIRSYFVNSNQFNPVRLIIPKCFYSNGFLKGRTNSKLRQRYEYTDKKRYNVMHEQTVSNTVLIIKVDLAIL